MEQSYCSDKNGGVIFTQLFDPDCSQGNTTTGLVAEFGAGCRNAGIAGICWEKGDKTTHCNRNLIALIIFVILTGHVICLGQQLDVQYTSFSHPCQFGNRMPVMTGENVSVGVHLTYTGPELEDEIVSMSVHITPNGQLDYDVATLCWGAELFTRLEQGDEIEIWCDAPVPFDLGLGWYYFIVEHDYASNIDDYPVASYVQVVRGGGVGACCFGGWCEDETQASCECDLHFAPDGTVRDTTYQGEGTMCLGDNDGDEADDACQGEPLPQTGACCSDMGCQELELQECADLTGRIGWMGLGTSCADVLCQEQWACCRPGYGCLEMWPFNCAVDGWGIPKIGVMCSENPCEEEETEACCWVNEICTDIPPSECLNGGGWPQGPGTSCPPTGFCEQDTACCYPSSGEICRDVVSPQSCIDQGGHPMAEGVMCNPGLCDPQACCYSDGTCLNLPPYECTGTPLGLWSQCLDDWDGDGWDDACFKPPDCLGDADGDGTIGINDVGWIVGLLEQAAPTYRINQDNPLWDSNADVDGDGVITINDVGFLVGMLEVFGPPDYSQECP